MGQSKVDDISQILSTSCIETECNVDSKINVLLFYNSFGWKMNEVLKTCTYHKNSYTFYDLNLKK